MPQSGRMPGPIITTRPTGFNPTPQPPVRPTFHPGINNGPGKWPKGKRGFGDPGLPPHKR